VAGSIKERQKASNNTAPMNQLDAEEARWFAVYTMAKREKTAARHLAEKGIKHYLPLQQVTRYYTRKVKRVELPLINGYIFAQITKKEYVPVLETPDVVNFVKFNKNLIAIPETEIDIIRRVVGDQLEAQVEAISFSIGEEVEIIGGQLTGIRGKLIARENKKEVLLELTTIGLALRVKVKEEWLRRV
jgi:transcription antitermination factor NusG